MSFLAAFAAGVLGAMGLGGGGVLLLWLANIGMPQQTAQGINLLFILPVGLIGLWLHRKNGLAELSAALPVLLGGLPGVLLGSLLCGLLPTATLSKIFGGFIVAVGLREAVLGVRLLRKNKANRPGGNKSPEDGEK